MSLEYNGHDVRIAAKLRKAGPNLLILLHGIGCTKESFDGVFNAESLQDYSICAFDFPGHGESSKRLPSKFFTLRSYADITHIVIEQLVKRGSRSFGPRTHRPSRIFVAGHSMGGSVGILLAEGRQDVECLVSMDGNLVAEDCGLVSRSIAEQNAERFSGEGFGRFIASLQASKSRDSLTWAEWCAKTTPAAMHEAARSLVEWSDSGKLLDRFNTFERKAYLYGDQDDKQYLLRRFKDAAVSAVPNSGHFMMVDNPDSFYQLLSRALDSGNLSVKLTNFLATRLVANVVTKRRLR